MYTICKTSETVDEEKCNVEFWCIETCGPKKDNFDSIDLHPQLMNRQKCFALLTKLFFIYEAAILPKSFFRNEVALTKSL